MGLMAREGLYVFFNVFYDCLLGRSFVRLSCYGAVVIGRVTCWSRRQRSLQWRAHTPLWSVVIWSRPASSTTTSSWKSRRRYSRLKPSFLSYSRSADVSMDHRSFDLHSFLWAAEFWATLRELPISTEYQRLRGILQNSAFAFFTVVIHVCEAFWQNCQSSLINWLPQQSAKLHCNREIFCWWGIISDYRVFDTQSDRQRFHAVQEAIGDRTFPVAAASVWNSLPESVWASPSLQVFRSRLKTELFARSYSCSD